MWFPLLSLLPMATTVAILHPLQTTERISLNSNEVEAIGSSTVGSLSADGRFVAFDSGAFNLVPGDTNARNDVFIRDRQTGTTRRASVDSFGVEGNETSQSPQISADGRYVLFTSWSILSSLDTNGAPDAYLHDRLTSTTTLVSVNSNGVLGNSSSFGSSLSADGRTASFHSYASNLVTGDTNGEEDVFVRDLTLGITSRVSISSAGVEGDDMSSVSYLSADGRFVLFNSRASSLVVADTNSEWDFFVHDRSQGSTTRISVNSFGGQANRGSWGVGSISSDGRFVSFQSLSTNLVAGDTNGEEDVFVHDTQTGTTERVSVDSSGFEANDSSIAGSLSADGRLVSFQSSADNLITTDINVAEDIFLHDRMSGETTIISVDSAGLQVNEGSSYSIISKDGRWVAFRSDATNLVPNDWNLETDVFLHDRLASTEINSIILTGPFLVQAGSPVELQWFGSPPGASYSLLVSGNRNGTTVAGHDFDLGTPSLVVATGLNSALGTGSFLSAAIPLGMAGSTIHFELACLDVGPLLFDSIVQSVEIN